jgi:CubicO group peptidase (beta-lactamase class C family)
VHDVQPKSLTVKAPKDSPAAFRPEIKGEKSLVHAPRSAVRKIFAGNKKAEIIVPPQRRFCRNLRRAAGSLTAMPVFCWQVCSRAVKPDTGALKGESSTNCPTNPGNAIMRLPKYPVLSSLLCLCATALALAGELPRGLPEQAGLSSSKLERAKSVMQAMVDKHETAGAVTIAARQGKVVYLEAVGLMDIEAGKPMRPDTIFRIYSMSKPVTTVAAMLLWEDGKFQLDDPVSRYLPEFKGLRVHAGGKSHETVSANREVTVRDLMRHTSGLTYGAFGDSPVDRLYRERKVLDSEGTLADMVAKLGKLPLMYQPGTRFQYSVSTDVLGRLVEVISGKPLDQFFEERIFKPLDMIDTAFSVPEEKLVRFAVNYGPRDKGGLKVIDEPAKSKYRSRPKLLSGGGGLVSTARDYLRFCQMLVAGGKLEGTRLLRAETVQQMTSNQLPEEALKPGLGVMGRPGIGFGLGFSVRLAAPKAEPTAVVGEYGWGGAASTHFWISPKHKLAVVALQQYMPYTPRLETALKPIFYEAIVD